MAKKKEIQGLLAHTYGGVASDWQRVSKRKDAAGQPVRAFVNESLGLSVLTVEALDGSPRLGLPVANP